MNRESGARGTWLGTTPTLLGFWLKYLKIYVFHSITIVAVVESLQSFSWVKIFEGVCPHGGSNC